MSSGWSKLTGGVSVHGLPSGRPGGQPPRSSLSGTSGSRSGMSKCTGPALAVRAPVAATSTRQVAERQVAFSASIRSGASSARPRLMVARTWVPK
ncbi:hypothetical protein C1Y40_03374 [Mycobacterium talmoniae]|uniref:Uncharacterized protein n=1 Tax=Mycobacterium talmoniae TaxID=1858794 RepID=A0A2S8BIM4_9MYCO|nr:hypothetical protein C1Y40_03374 [Mycobacterium talmoniae]